MLEVRMLADERDSVTAVSHTHTRTHARALIHWYRHGSFGLLFCRKSHCFPGFRGESPIVTSAERLSFDSIKDTFRAICADTDTPRNDE